jgi:hypothetical protein
VNSFYRGLAEETEERLDFLVEEAEADIVETEKAAFSKHEEIVES